MKRLEGKTAVITGGSKGIGLAIAAAFADEGASVVISSRSQESVDRAVTRLESHGYSAKGIAADVGELNEVEKILKFCLEQYGKVDIWFNNAATSAPYGPVWLLDEEKFENLMKTNILGAYYGSITAMRYFIPRGAGKLINMLGAGAQRPAPFQTAYGSSKAWLRSFTKTLATESKDSGVGVFAYSPGMVLTEMLTDITVIEGYEDRLKAFPTILRMWANPPDKVTEKAVWLASEATDSKTGIEVFNMSPMNMIFSALKDKIRTILGREQEKINIKITTIPPAG